MALLVKCDECGQYSKKVVKNQILDCELCFSEPESVYEILRNALER